MDQLDSRIAVYSTDMQSNNQEYWVIHVYNCSTKPLCKFVDNSAHGTSNAEIMKKIWSPLTQGALGHRREPKVVGEIQRLLESPPIGVS